MTLLPIVERELREGARRKSVRYIRLIVAAVALVIGLIQLALLPFLMGTGKASGSASFAFMTGYAFLLSLLAGVFVTADCLSEEKREGTLGLLFLTDLRGYDVVLGKLASQLVHLGYALLAIIPAAALPVLLGGVTGGELWRISLALLNLLFFSLAAGMLASATCRQAGRAMCFTAGLLFATCALLPIAQSSLDSAGFTKTGEWLSRCSPTTVYVAAMSGGYSFQPQRFWNSLLVTHGLAWLMLAAASWRLPRSWQDRPITGRKVRWLERLNAGLGTARIRRERELLATDPLRWIVGESRTARVMSWGVAIVWALGMLTVGYFQTWEALMIVAIYGRMLFFPVKLLFAAQATRFFAETRRTGAFDLLLAAPISTSELVAAQWAMLRRVFLPPCILVIASSVLVMVYLFVVGNSSMEEMIGQLGVTGVFGTLFALGSILDFFAMGWLGMWLALTMRKPHLATGATILFVLILPSVMCGASVIVDIVLIAIFATKLRADFRQMVLERPAFASDTRTVH